LSDSQTDRPHFTYELRRDFSDPHINESVERLAFKSHRLNFFDELIVNFENARSD
jgi:hypothetical protein